jgi:hypothetical protein
MKRVDLDGRTFIVMYHDTGKPRSIKERKVKAGRVYDASYWHHTHGFAQGGIPDRILVRAGL